MPSLPPSCLRVLGALLAIAQSGQAATVRAICDRLGWASPYYAALMLRRLRAAGLVRYEDGRAHTLIPTCTLILFE